MGLFNSKQKNHKIKKINQTGVRKKSNLEEEVRIAEICISLQSIGTGVQKIK